MNMYTCIAFDVHTCFNHLYPAEKSQLGTIFEFPRPKEIPDGSTKSPDNGSIARLMFFAGAVPKKLSADCHRTGWGLYWMGV